MTSGIGHLPAVIKYTPVPIATVIGTPRSIVTLTGAPQGVMQMAAAPVGWRDILGAPGGSASIIGAPSGVREMEGNMPATDTKITHYYHGEPLIIQITAHDPDEVVLGEEEVSLALSDTAGGDPLWTGTETTDASGVAVFTVPVEHLPEGTRRFFNIWDSSNRVQAVGSVRVLKSVQPAAE
ncbi:hypothetical protein E2K80_01255 [Rhodophyticola sp. CCM32]|uniref:hypothetical protein n=1 Tax=Rhodophyticola sp. CCM32 TaxID=2916397 RepID=UPI00107F1793|nr:hypothetical protein [Rhodophyticola sp. CCM32]QBX99521.1 hypothetical protein E2K80_01255 [Rhodophyticola sp. CCM32]